MNRTYSREGLKLTEDFEGLRLEAYLDSVGVPTIGYGHTAGVQLGMVWTNDQAETALMEDIEFVVRQINRNATIDLGQHRFDSLVDFAFNLGWDALYHSTLWRYMMAGNFAAADHEFPKWDHAGGKELAGLERRRVAEVALGDKPDDVL